MTSKPGAARGRVLAAVVIVVLVLVAGGVVYLLLRPQQRTPAAAPAPASKAQAPANRAVVDAAATRQVGDQVGSAVATAYSYDSTKLDRHRAQVGDLVVGKARKDLAASLATLRGKPPASVDTEVVKRAVTELAGDRATVLVALREHVRSGGQTRDVPARMLVSAHHRGALWQITDTDKTFDEPQPRPHARGETAAAQRDRVLAAAMGDAEVLSSSDYRNPGKSLDGTIRVTTGGLHDKAVRTRQPNLAKLTEQHTIVTARAVAAGVERMDGRAGSAAVLVALNADVTGKDGQRHGRPSTVELRMREVGGRWLISGVQNL